MTPTSWLAVLLFLLLIAPGLQFDLLAASRRVSNKESAFRETSRIVLASLGFSAFGCAVVALVRIAQPSWMPDPRRFLANPHSYLVQHYGALAAALLVAVGAALVASLLAHLVLLRKTDARFRAQSAWSRVLRDDVPDGYVAHVRAKMSNGTVYIGRLANYTADLELADRELALVPPLFIQAEGNELSDVPAEWQRIVLRGPSIDALMVQYRRPPPE